MKRYLLFLLILTIGFPHLAQADKPYSCVILLVNRLSLDDIASGQLPEMAKAMNSSGMGLLNLRTIGGYGPEKILLGISAGSPTTSNTDGGLFLSNTEDYYRVSGQTLYQRFYGSLPTGSISNPLYGSIGQQNQTAEYLNQIGALGSMLHQKKLRTGLWGQSDPDMHTVNRSAGLIIADAQGRIDGGQIDDSVTVTDPNFPSGRRINEQALWDSYKAAGGNTALSVIDWGDLDVLDFWAGVVPIQRIPVLRAQALRRLDQFFLRLYRDARSRGQRLLVISTAPPRVTSPSQRLGIVLIHDPHLKPGLLQSTTTKSPGMITPYDLHQYLVDRLGLPGVRTSIGAPITTSAGDFNQLHRFYLSLLQTEADRAPVLIFLIYLTSLGLIIGGIMVFIGQNRGKSASFIRWLLQLTMNLPVILLLIPLFRPENVVLHILSSVGLAALMTLVIRRISPRNVDQLAVTAGITTIAILTDAFLRGPLSQRSALGYSLITGARYYGLGNEFTGILIGSLLLISGLYLHLAGRQAKTLWRVAIGFLITLTLITFPFFGANIGDLIPLLIVLGITLLLHWNKAISPGHILALSSLVALVFSGFAIYDATRSNPTHLGQLVQDISRNGLQAAMMMIQRKLAMNWKLIQYSRWTLVVLIVLVLFPIALRHPRGPLRRVFQNHPTLRPSYIGIAFAGLGSFIFNDSGIVAAATTYLIPSLAMLFMMFDTIDS